MSAARRYVDVSTLPGYAFGSRQLMWWGAVGFMVIEGSMFAMLLAAWGYLRGAEPAWPPPGFAPPPLVWGTVNTVVLLASAWPNHRVRLAAHALDFAHAHRWMLVAHGFSVAFMVVRVLELSALNVRWDSNAYGSIVWAIMVFHTLHLLTDVVETMVLDVMMRRDPGPRRLIDVSDGCLYWDFIVLAWLPVYLTVYLAPRWT